MLLTNIDTVYYQKLMLVKILDVECQHILKKIELYQYSVNIGVNKN